LLGKRVAGAFLAGLLSLMNGQVAGAIPPDPRDPPELPDPPFEAPPGGFSWSVPANFGPLNAQGIVDYRWNEAADSHHAGPAYTYDPAYVRPASRTARFDGCPTQAEADASPTTYNYTWTVHDSASGAPMGAPVTQRDCRWTRDFALDGVTGRSTPVKVRLAVTNVGGGPYPGYPAGKTFDEQPVEVRDLLIVSIGDSYGSGEGAPDRAQVIDGLGYVSAPATWVDRRCHRSAAAPSAVAARSLESADPHSTVTFLSFACSGATVSQEYFGDQSNFDPYRPGQFTKPKGNGILGPYMGVEPPDPNDFSEAAKLPSQVQQLTDALTTFGAAPARQVQALSISAGGNDMGFGPIASVCTLYYECKDHFVSGANGEGPRPLYQRFGQSLATMPARYGALDTALSALPIDRTYITQYPDPTRNDGGGLCAKILDDVIPGWMAPFLALGAAVDFSPVPLPPYQMDGGDRPDGGEVGWAGNEVLPGINGAVGNGAVANGWTLVDGIADATGNLFSGHGYCASDNWIRRASEATAMQGPWDPPLNCNLVSLIFTFPIFVAAGCLPPATTKTTGTLHPTARGYQAVGGRLLAKMRPDLLPPPAGGDAPVPTFAEDRSQSVAGANGWLTGAAASHTCAAGASRCVPVQLSAGVPPGTTLRGVEISLDGVPLPCPAGGATTGAVTCRSELVNPQTNGWSLSFAADGIHRVEVTATAHNGTRADGSYEYKVDLNDPTAASATPVSSDPGTNGWYRGPVGVTLGGTDAAGGSGVQGVEYSLDGGPVTLVPDGTQGRLDSDGVHAFSAIRPVDWAGRRGPEAAPVEVRIDQTAPAITCGGTDGAWHAGDVAVACTASDGGSGLADPAADAAFTLSTSVAEGTETADAATGSREVCDVAGNCPTAGPVGGHRVDRRGPSIVVTTPSGGSYLLGQAVPAAYACTDGGSGVATCAGPVAAGANLDTGSVGARTFAVQATDAVGNQASATASYTVGYRVRLGYDPAKAKNGGSTVPVDLRLCDAAGVNRSTAAITPTAVGVVNAVSGQAVPLQSPGNSQPGNRFKFESGAYTFNVKSTGYPAGTYHLRFTVPGDPTTYVAPFAIR
jgi:hypothetical protein